MAKVTDIECDDIEGLDEFVRDIVNDELPDTDDKIEKYVSDYDYSDVVKDELRDQLPDAIDSELDDVLDDKIVDVLKDNEDVEKIMVKVAKEVVLEILHEKVRSIVKDCLQEAIAQLFNVPKALPVVTGEVNQFKTDLQLCADVINGA